MRSRAVGIDICPQGGCSLRLFLIGCEPIFTLVNLLNYRLQLTIQLGVKLGRSSAV